MKTQTTNEKLIVVVGTNLQGYCDAQLAEREQLAQKIEECGFRVERVSVAWPRDHYTFHDGSYAIKKIHGKPGEGGYFNFGREFVLVSERLFGHYTPVDFGKIQREVELHYPYKKIHIVPTGYDPDEISALNGPMWIDHVDLTCLTIPSKRLLFVDKNFYTEQKSRDSFSGIASQEDYQIVFHDSAPKSSFKYFPLNCLVLPCQNGEEVVFANKRVPSFLKLLEKYKINFETVDFKITPGHTGSIRCCTNSKDETMSLDELLDSDE
ncbi:hypothetical protein HZA97_07000 [Candidatus Woesearchaeota archaeon]|nr:hypothetical protein [Candidatus Woesearchaeota archaeon]